MNSINQNEVNILLTKLKSQLNIRLPNSINSTGINRLNSHGRERVGSSATNAIANFETHGVEGLQNIDITVLNVTNIQTNGTTSSGTFVCNANFKSSLICTTQGFARYKFLFSFKKSALKGQTRISNSAVMATGSFSVTEINNQIKINTFNLKGFNLNFGNRQTNISIHGYLGGLNRLLIGRVESFVRNNSIPNFHIQAQNGLRAHIQQQIDTEIKSI